MNANFYCNQSFVNHVHVTLVASYNVTIEGIEVGYLTKEGG